MGHHAAITRKDRFDAVFTHTLQDFLLQSNLLCIPAIRIRSAPAFKVIHQPPGKKARTGYELIYFGFGISQLIKHVIPHSLCPGHSQRDIDAVQSHPVYFFLPSVPIPESHGIRKSTIVQIITVRQGRFSPFFFCHRRKHSRQFCLHSVPGKVDTGIILQIPIQPGSDAHVIVSTDNDFITLLIEFKKVGTGLHLLDNKLLRSSFVYALQQAGHRRSHCQRSNTK